MLWVLLPVGLPAKMESKALLVAWPAKAKPKVLPVAWPAKMEPEALAKLERAILPVTMQVEQVDGTWKLNQNKPEAARLGAAENIAGSTGADLPALSALMKAPPA